MATTTASISPRCCLTLFTSSSAAVIAADKPKAAAISSPSNPFVKHCVKLRLSSSYRHSCSSALVVGLTPISEITQFAESKGRVDADGLLPLIDSLLVLEGAEEAAADCCSAASSVVRVSPAVMKKVAGLQSVDSTEAVAVMRIPRSFCSVSEGDESIWLSQFPFSPSPKRILVLDGVQDPGNLGTLLRTAIAFRWDAAFLLPGCCDPFNDKALRASRGASFQFPIISAKWVHLETLRNKFQMRMLAAHPGNDGEQSAVSLPLSRDLSDTLADQALCVVLGSEGQGLSEPSRRNCELVSIPMAGQFESLNVSIAGGILLYMLQPTPSAR